MIVARKAAALVALGALVLGTVACGNTFRAGAAVVNGTRISQDVVDRQAKAQAQNPATALQGGSGDFLEVARDVLLNKIQQELIRQEAARRKIRATAAEIEERLRNLQAQFPSEQEFRTRAAEAGFTLADVRRDLEVQVLAERLRDAIVSPITDAQVREVYQTSQDQFRQIRFRHILFRVDENTTDKQALRKARTALTRLKAGEDFADLARKQSEDPGSKDKGGLYDYTPLASLDPAFAAAARDAKRGTVTEPVRGQAGYHLILVLGERVQPLKEVAGRIRDDLSQRTADQDLSDLVERLSRESRVVVNPRYGDWDSRTGAIVPHQSFVPAEPEVDATLPGGLEGLLPVPGGSSPNSTSGP